MMCIQGGAQDSRSYQAVLKKGRLPSPNSITYIGVFSEHYFDTGKPEPKKVVSMSNYYSVSLNPTNKTPEVYISSFVKSCMDGEPRSPDPIDVAIVLDISGSMASSLEKQTKLELAKSAVNALLVKSLRNDDGFGFCTFNDKGTVILDIAQKSEINLDSFNQALAPIQAGGGTTLEAGLGTARDMFHKYQATSSTQYRQKRILMVTDMDDLGKDLEVMIKNLSLEGIYVSVIGIGINFNVELTDSITKTEGANYFYIGKDEEMKEVLVDQFHYNFFPCAFNMIMRIESDAFEVDKTYGTGFEDTHLETSIDALGQIQVEKGLNDNHLKNQVSHSIQCISEINTVTPSAMKNGQTKGGLLLIKLRPKQVKNYNGQVKMILTYKDKTKLNQLEEVQTINIDHKSVEDYYQNEAIRKGVLLYRYVDATKQILTAGQSHSLEVSSEQIQDATNFQKYLNANISDYYPKDQLFHKVKEDFGKLMELCLKDKGSIKPGKKCIIY